MGRPGCPARTGHLPWTGADGTGLPTACGRVQVFKCCSSTALRLAGLPGGPGPSGCWYDVMRRPGPAASGMGRQQLDRAPAENLRSRNCTRPDPAKVRFSNPIAKPERKPGSQSSTPHGTPDTARCRRHIIGKPISAAISGLVQRGAVRHVKKKRRINVEAAAATGRDASRRPRVREHRPDGSAQEPCRVAQPSVPASGTNRPGERGSHSGLPLGAVPSRAMRRLPSSLCFILFAQWGAAGDWLGTGWLGRVRLPGLAGVRPSSGFCNASPVQYVLRTAPGLHLPIAFRCLLARA